MDNFLITLEDIRYAIGKKCCCVSGAKEFFRLNGLDWKDFMKNGLHRSEFEKIDDETCKTFLEACKERRYGRRRR